MYKQALKNAVYEIIKLHTDIVIIKMWTYDVMFYVTSLLKVALNTITLTHKTTDHVVLSNVTLCNFHK
jgi:hypothetical protein